MDNVSNYISNKLREQGYHVSPETIQDMISTGIGLTGMSPESLTSYVIDQLTGSITSRLGFNNHDTIPIPNDVPIQTANVTAQYGDEYNPDNRLDFINLNNMRDEINFENNFDSGNNIPPTNNEGNNNMSEQAPLRGSPVNGAALAGAGKGDPQTNFHALGTQDAGDTYDVGFMKAERLIQPAETVKFKMHYTPNTSGRDLKNPAPKVFPISSDIGVDTLYPLTTINLNHGFDHIEKYGEYDNTGYWRNPNNVTAYVPNRWNEYANKYKHYKVLKTRVTIKMKHLGNSSFARSGMPIRQFGWRQNTHNKVISENENRPKLVGEVKESPFGFQISDFIYPKFNRSIVAAAGPNTAIQATGYNTGLPTEFTYTYTYDSEDATTQVDLDGDMNNKAMWAATDSIPPDEQKLMIFAAPMFIREYDNASETPLADEGMFPTYKNATVWAEIDIEQIVQFRDIKYEYDIYHTQEYLNVTNPI